MSSKSRDSASRKFPKRTVRVESSGYRLEFETRCARLTIVEIRDGFQDTTACVQRSWCVDSTGGGPAGEKDDLGVDERSRGDALDQSLAERECGCHWSQIWVTHRPTFYTILVNVR